MTSININNLKVGHTYKNWKELCVTLGVEPKSHSYKVKQEKEFKRYFSWTKQGQKITIVEIFETPKEKEDGRKMNRFTVRHEQESFFSPDELQIDIRIGLLEYVPIALNGKRQLNNMDIFFQMRCILQQAYVMNTYQC